MLEGNISKEEYKEVKVICPQCNANRKVKLPERLIKESAHLVTISIPRNYMCPHGFQAFIDKNFKIRGYQRADFEIQEMEIYETGKSMKKVNLVINYQVSLIIKRIIENMERAVGFSEILGGALITESRKVLYLSLPDEIFLDVLRQLEFQSEKFQENIIKSILVLENGCKLCIEQRKMENIILIIVVLFSSETTLIEANNYLTDIVNLVEIKKTLEQKRDMEKAEAKLRKADKTHEVQGTKGSLKGPSNYWIYSKIESKKPLYKTERVYIKTLGCTIDKKNILNIEEIIEHNKTSEFIGKIYFSENYVKLMEGLAATMKDASNFLEKLNKIEY